MGLPWYDLEVQLEHSKRELQSGYFEYDGRDLLEILRTSDDPAYTAKAVAISYEGPEYLSNPRWHGTSKYYETLDARAASARYISDMILTGNFAGIDVECD
jgi:hypothetical protein